MRAGFDNRISLQKLEIFCLVVELEGVGRAAEHLFVAQPVVTAHLRSLQERLGAQLFYRDGRRLKLTESGERAYAWAAETLARTRDLSRELGGLSDGSRGSALIASSMSIGSYVLPTILTRFRQRWPNVEITLNISDPEHATDAAERGDCDFALVVSKEPPMSPRLIAEQFGREPVVLVAAADGPPEASSIGIADLETLPLVTTPRHQIRRALIDHRLRMAGVEPQNVAIELGHPEAMKRAVEDGAGAALLFRSSVARELANGTMREIHVEGWDFSVPVFLLLRDDKRLTPIQESLVDELRSEVGRQLLPAEPAAAAA